jgi:hypothetical protein
MRITIHKTSRLLMLAFGLVLVLMGTSLVCGQGSSAQTTVDRTANIRSVPSGSKMKLKGSLSVATQTPSRYATGAVRIIRFS